MVRELSVHQEHELLNKLEDAGLGKDLAQAIINSKENTLAKQIVDFANQKIDINGYKFIKRGIVIESQERNRQEILGDSSKFIMGDNFKSKVYIKLQNGRTDAEILRESELLKYKKDKEIMEDMKISEITPDQVAERIIQFGKIEHWIIIGYCEGLVVYALPNGVGRVGVSAYELGDWNDGNRLLSRDIDAL